MRPIDADDLKALWEGISPKAMVYPASVIDSIDRQPTVNMAHAHWIELRSNSGNVHYKCSRCGKEVSYSYAKKRWKYCIECGAKMDEQKNVSKIIEEVIKDICDNCKYTKTYKDNYEMLIDNKCRNCPLNGL